MQTLAAVAMMLLPAACADDYDDSALWDKVNDHEERLAALEKWQEQTNQSIAAMQELLNTTDLITGVSAVSEGGQTVGYTITFLHSDPITIYNGTPGADGEDGADGADGQTPQIGLAQAEDGNWYWTLNGETLTDADGNPIRANGLDGADGEDGEDGATGPEGPQGDDGTSAPTPQIKLGSNVTGTIMTDNGQTIADAWYLSVDGGATWYRVSGTDGTNGDAWFAKAPEKVGNYYLFTLADQSTFRVAAYQPFCILAEGETIGTFDNATVPVNEATTLYLSIDEGIEYSSIVAQVTPVDADAVLTRADGWSAKVAESTDGITVTVTPPTQAGYALLDVSLLLTDGGKLTASRLLAYDPGYTDDGQGNYTVTSAEGLKNIAKLVNEEGKTDIDITLTGNITLTGDWTPIGTSISNAYKGTFNGGGHTITGLTVTTSDQYAGLFGYIGSGGTVKDVTLEGVQIATTHSVGDAGGVAGWSYGNIENCSVSGSVSCSGSHSIAGGVVGYQSGGFLTGCSSSATVNAGGVAGGVAGLTDRGATLTACYATGDVTIESSGTGSYFAGGVVGNNGSSSTLKACYAWGNVTGSGSGTVYVGGVTGSNDLGNLTACYHAKGTVSGPGGATGGVAGRNFKDSMLGSGIITACYWGDNGQEEGIGENQAGTGETTKVTDGLWQTAVDAMNAAIETWNTANPDKTCDWRYELGDEGLPVLTQQP